MAENTERGFAAMDEDKRRDIAAEDRHASGGNFAEDRGRASEAGKKGAEAEPREAKVEGGQHSHQNQ